MDKPSPEERNLAHFAAALRQDSLAIPANLDVRNGDTPARRFAIYRNNVQQGLTEALAARHPVTEALVGKTFFRSMASEFVAVHPPRSPVLLEWGDDLAPFVEAFEPARSVPYLADIVRLEAARSRAYHAADVRPLTPDAFAALEPDVLENVRLTAHPAMSVLPSAYPCLTIWERHQDGRTSEPVDDWQGEDVLVTRPQLLVEMRRLPPGGALFLRSLQDGLPLGQAATLAAGYAECFDLTLALTVMIESGSFIGLQGEQAS